MILGMLVSNQIACLFLANCLVEELVLRIFVDELSVFLSLDFAFHLKENNNSMTSEALPRLPENRYQFRINSNIISSLSMPCYSFPLSDISAIQKNDQDFVHNTTSKSGNIGNAEY